MSAFNLRQIETEVNKIVGRNAGKYVGNLKREQRIFALRQHHFLMADCDNKGNLIPKDLLVQFLGVKIRNESHYVLICRNCVDDAEGLLHILMKNHIEKVKSLI